MSREELDPEVVADLQLRAATERDRSRSREMPQWSPSVVLTHVPCRKRCGSLVEWNDAAEERFVAFNRMLEARGEAPLDKTKILFCDKCRVLRRQAVADHNRKQVDLTGEVIRDLRRASNPDGERDLIAKLRELGHPDIDGLLETLRTRNKTQSGKRTKGDL